MELLAVSALTVALHARAEPIALFQLDPATGKPPETNTPIYSLACYATIEAAYLRHHEKFYCLFVNWDRCRAGTNSTDNIRVGVRGLRWKNDGWPALEP